MALNPSNSGSLEQLALKGLNIVACKNTCLASDELISLMCGMLFCIIMYRSYKLMESPLLAHPVDLVFVIQCTLNAGFTAAVV